MSVKKMAEPKMKFGKKLKDCKMSTTSHRWEVQVGQETRGSQGNVGDPSIDSGNLDQSFLLVLRQCQVPGGPAQKKVSSITGQIPNFHAASLKPCLPIP